MTKPFTPRQKYRILVAFDAQVIVDGALVHVARYVYGTMSETRRFSMLRDLDCIVRCACGCKVWAQLRDIEFDHRRNWASGGRSTIDNGQPLRTHPCHRNIKCAGEQAITGWVRKVKRKLTVTIARDDSSTDEVTRTRKRSWPSCHFPKSSRPIPSRPFPARRPQCAT